MGGELYPPVRVDLMRPALDAFDSAHRRFGPKRWSGKAEDAVLKVVKSEHWRTQFSYVKRCHAFRNMTKDGVPKSLWGWVLPDGSIHDAAIAAIALTPLRTHGKFLMKEFRATIEKAVDGQSVNSCKAG